MSSLWSGGRNRYRGHGIKCRHIFLIISAQTSSFFCFFSQSGRSLRVLQGHREEEGCECLEVARGCFSEWYQAPGLWCKQETSRRVTRSPSHHLETQLTVQQDHVFAWIIGTFWKGIFICIHIVDIGLKLQSLTSVQKIQHREIHNCWQGWLGHRQIPPTLLSWALHSGARGIALGNVQICIAFRSLGLPSAEKPSIVTPCWVALSLIQSHRSETSRWVNLLLKQKLASKRRALVAQRLSAHYVQGGIDIHMAVWRACLSYAGDAR